MTGEELLALIARCGGSLKARDAGACAARIRGALSDEDPALADEVGLEAFAEAIAASCPDEQPLEAHLESLPEGLLIIAGCVKGSSPAIAAFEERYFGALAPALSRMNLDADTIDEVRQRVRQKLFVRAGSSSTLLDFVGKGSLSNFVRVVAVRTAIDLLRQSKPGVRDPDEVLLNVRSPAESPQLRVLKARYKNEFKDAFEQAMASLEPQERNLLRMSFVAKLTVDEIGGFYRVHRATAARRLARARARLAELTKERLHDQLQLDEGDFTSILQLIQSQLDLSISRILVD